MSWHPPCSTWRRHIFVRIPGATGQAINNLQEVSKSRSSPGGEGAGRSSHGGQEAGPSTSRAEGSRANEETRQSGNAPAANGIEGSPKQAVSTFSSNRSSEPHLHAISQLS